MEIPEFHGLMNVDKFLDWLCWVEKIFEYRYIPDHKRVKLVATRMTRYALVWCDSLQNDQIQHWKAKLSPEIN